MKNRNLRAQVIAGNLGIAAEARSDVAVLLDWDSVDDPEDDKQLERALKALVKEKPFLLGGRDGADGGAGGSRDRTKTDMNSLIRAGAGRGVR